MQVDLPWMVWTLPLMRLLPVWAFDGLADFFGITVAMDEFTGRGGTRPRAERRKMAPRDDAGYSRSSCRQYPSPALMECVWVCAEGSTPSMPHTMPRSNGQTMSGYSSASSR